MSKTCMLCALVIYLTAVTLCQAFLYDTKIFIQVLVISPNDNQFQFPKKLDRNMPEASKQP